MLRNPLVFVFNILETQHALFQTALFDHIKDIFNQDNQQCIFLPVRNPQTTNLNKRADYIHTRLSQFRNPHVVGLSVAGLDCRHAICKLGTKVESLTTISSPNHGSIFADLLHVEQGLNHFSKPVARILGITERALDEITPSMVGRLNKSLPPREDVKQYSISSWKSPEIMTHALYELGTFLELKVKFDKKTSDGVFFSFEMEWGDHLATFDMDHTEIMGSNLKNNCAPVYRLVLDNLLRHERIKANLVV